MLSQFKLVLIHKLLVSHLLRLSFGDSVFCFFGVSSLSTVQISGLSFVNILPSYLPQVFSFSSMSTTPLNDPAWMLVCRACKRSVSYVLCPPQERIAALEEQRAAQRELIAAQAEQIAAQLEQLTAQQERIVAQQTCLEQQRQLILAQEAWIAGARQRERMGAKRWERNAALEREQRLIQEREAWEERRVEEMLALALLREVAAESCDSEELVSTNVERERDTLRRPTEFPADLLPIIVRFHPDPVWKRMAAPLKRPKGHTSANVGLTSARAWINQQWRNILYEKVPQLVNWMTRRSSRWVLLLNNPLLDLVLARMRQAPVRPMGCSSSCEPSVDTGRCIVAVRTTG